jgi:DNA-binding GntR family transcriptional regulator
MPHGVTVRVRAVESTEGHHSEGQPDHATEMRITSHRTPDPVGGPTTPATLLSDPFDEPSLVDRATTEIRHAILSGQLRPGQAFSLRNLAGQLGVSFIPVREALRGLEREGLVVIRRGRSTSVAPLSSDDLHSLCQLRRRIEPELAADACLLISSSELDKHELRLERACQAPDQSWDPYEAHRELLGALLGPTATSWDLRMLHMLWHATERYLRFSLDHRDQGGAGGRTGNPLRAAQVDLIRAFRTRDPREAKAAMLHHVDWAEQVADQGITARV